MGKKEKYVKEIRDLLDKFRKKYNPLRGKHCQLGDVMFYVSGDNYGSVEGDTWSITQSFSAIEVAIDVEKKDLSWAMLGQMITQANDALEEALEGREEERQEEIKAKIKYREEEITELKKRLKG